MKNKLQIIPKNISRAMHNVSDHYTNPKNMGTFPEEEKNNVYTTFVGSYDCGCDCGSVICVQIKYDPKTYRIIDTKFTVSGCASHENKSNT